MNARKSWEKDPWSLISFVDNGAKEAKGGVQPMINDMIAIHNCLIRGLNAIYLQCINIERSPQDIPDFVSFALVWAKVIHTHHDEEEADVFPDIEQKTGITGLMAGNIEQHRAFHDGIEQYDLYLKDVRSGRLQYDGQKFKGIIDSFATALHQHLVDEIPTLLSLKEYSDKVDWAKYWATKSAEIINRASSDSEAKTVFMPFCLSCHDPTFEDGIVSWPAMPWIAKMLFRYYFTPQHKNWWRFGAVDINGKPQELPFVYKDLSSQPGLDSTVVRTG